MALRYNAPDNGQPSTIDGDGSQSEQLQTYRILKEAIITARKEQFFTQLASTIGMPKHFGKKCKVYEYIPLLDDRNKNDQGIDANGVTIKDGNLYGSSKDIGVITSKLPVLTENGGRVNRVGFTRIVREGSIHKFGMFHEFTKEALDFDTDANLFQHLARELMNGSVETYEKLLQKDLLNAAGVILYSGVATQDSEMTPEEGEGGEESKCIVTYRNLMRLDQILTNNRCPKHTKILSGTRMIDTKTIPSCRIAYVGSEVVPILKEMKDLFGNKAFIEAHHYAANTTLLNGEIGSIDNFRFIQVPEMLHWGGKGKSVGDESGYHNTGGKYDIFPILVVGDDSFTTIGFQTSGKSAKFSVITKMPGEGTADRWDPYGEMGFSSIKWWYGFLCKRPERIAIIKTCAPL